MSGRCFIICFGSRFLAADAPRAVTALTVRPIGTVQSVFTQKNGTPRQGLLAPHARAKLCGLGLLPFLKLFI
jgi:hypothetical protein